MLDAVTPRVTNIHLSDAMSLILFKLNKSERKTNITNARIHETIKMSKMSDHKLRYYPTITTENKNKKKPKKPTKNPSSMQHSHVNPISM